MFKYTDLQLTLNVLTDIGIENLVSHVLLSGFDK
jgi:hypothetical protein